MKRLPFPSEMITESEPPSKHDFWRRNNNPIGCDALLIPRYYLAESVSWLPHGPILSEASWNLAKRTRLPGPIHVPASFRRTRGHGSLFQACPVSSARPWVT